MPSAARPFAHFQLASPRYFEAVGIRLARGRAFDQRDKANSLPVCIINEEFARRYFEGRDPVGALINTVGETRQVVGVIRQVKVQGPADGAASGDLCAVHAVRVRRPWRWRCAQRAIRWRW